MIIIDLEWNQPAVPLPEDDPDYFPGDIIEIGSVKVDGSYRVTDRFRELVRPELLPVLTAAVKKLTRISQEEIRMKDTLRTVLPRFLQWCGDDHLFGEWGTSDELALRQNADAYGMELPEEERQDFINRINDNVKAITKIVDDMLKMSEQSSTDYYPRTGSIQLNQFLSQLI